MHKNELFADFKDIIGKEAKIKNLGEIIEYNKKGLNLIK